MRQLRMRIVALALYAGILGATSLAVLAQAEPYDECIALVASDPGRAEVEALRWAEVGGGAPAKHCRALALIAQGAERRGAELIIEIATDDRTLPDEVRSELLIEAGQIYLALGDTGPGLGAASRALQLARDPRAALVLSARLKADQGDWKGAVSDLDGALARGEPDAEMLVLRASARLHLGEKIAARGDLMWAAEIAPDLASVWLERGTLEEASDDRDAARAAWLRAIELDRDGIIAEAARLRLQSMEAGN